ncbi:MAG: chemotaxis protein CheA [Magnetococcales bacterium]|nr:chemotaxis protein CheA [Magnetococcales bacterium]
MFDEETQKELLQEFFSENREALGRIEMGLLQLESDPTDRDRLNSIFRDMHTVKGNCRMMGFERLEELTHAAETLLDLMREGVRLLDQRIGNTLLEVLDTVREALQEIAQTGSEGEADFTRSIAALARLQPEATDDGQPSTTPSEQLPDWALQGSSDQGDANHDSPAVGDSSAVGEKTQSVSVKLESIQLSIDRLDSLMNQVGELGAAFNQLKYAIASNPDQIDQILEVHGQQIYRLQDELLQCRLQPIGRVWQSYHRLVRDLAVETGKKVILELVGEETEVDRHVLVAIREVLGHLIRNAVDHGVEPPQERSVKGKSPIGRVTLSAEQKHGQIYLEIADDGRGIDVDRVRAKALVRHLITHEQANEMKEAEILKLIMMPGFSTADQVSKISGRGTGMDVVQTAIDKMGGSISIFNQAGHGSRFRLRIPQTMAIVPVLLVSNDTTTYAVPQVNIIELVSFYGQEILSQIESKLQSPMVRVRNHLYPLVPLQRTLARNGPGRSGAREMQRLRGKEAVHVVVVQSEEQIFGLEVDTIREPASLVIKPMARLFGHVTILAGTAVMPDGSVSFLLNVPELIKFINE